MGLRRKKRVLLVDSDRSVIDSLTAVLGGAGHEVRAADTGPAGEEILRVWKPDVVLVDLRLSGVDGPTFLRRLRALQPEAGTVGLTVPGSIQTVVEAVKAGAFDVLEKPVDRARVLAVVGGASAGGDSAGDGLHSRARPRDRRRFSHIVGKSRKMLELFDLVESVAGSEANILIEGENGTGKELIANAIHDHSKRAGGPFIKINCAAIPKDLIESELFGYRRGAFTGATADKEGLLETAEGGSLLLDEIGEMPSYLQTKLLRVLQEREYRPIGSDRVVRVDFRLICATNVNVDTALREGRIREDLFFRINTITIRVPPLRERTEDIPLLCEHFLATFRERYQKSVRNLSPAAYHVLIRNRWSGNVRELENAIERAVLVATGPDITPAELPESLRDDGSSASDFVFPPHWTLADIEKHAILKTLQRTNWNKQEAAALLGLYRPTLYSKMKKHDIQDPGRAARQAAQRT